jgi:hypothetical protein
LLAFWAFAVNECPPVGLALADLVAIGVQWRSPPLILGVNRQHPIRSYLCHSAARSFRLEIADEPVEIYIVAKVEADMHRAGKCGAHTVARLRPGVAISYRLLGVSILQELYDDVVELDKADVEPLRAAPQVRHSDSLWIDLALASKYFLIREERVMDRFP